MNSWPLADDLVKMILFNEDYNGLIQTEDRS